MLISRRLASLTVLATVVTSLTAIGPTTAEAAPATAGKPGHVDVLFIGAHPDDEGGELSTFGQWNENQKVTTGVVTITRGEGGGNATGPEEGPALGILREAEERRAVGKAGVKDVHNLDKVDFYYTVSAPLTATTWGKQDTLKKIVRLVREVRPKIIVTMNPSPFPGQHGNHQESAHLAIDAYYSAADPKVFPDQLSKEKLKTWRTSRIFTQGADGTGPDGPDCARLFVPTDPAAPTYGVWSGNVSKARKKTWAQIERDGNREYASQGRLAWAPTVPTDPSKLDCDQYTQIDSRVPFTFKSAATTAMLQGATQPAPGGLPLGTEFFLTTSVFGVSPGKPFTVTAHARAGAGVLPQAKAKLTLPAGWKSSGGGNLGAVTGVREATTAFTVTPPANAKVSQRVALGATLTSGRLSGTTSRAIEVSAPVSAAQQPLPQVADFQSWATTAGVPQLLGFVKPVLTVPSGGGRQVTIGLTNNSSTAQSGQVSVKLPAGFTADAASKPYANLAAGGKGSVTFTVRNSDPKLPTGNQGGKDGDYDYTITTTSAGASDTANAALELVPTTVIPKAAKAPTVDGVASPGEYGGPKLDVSRRWEDQDCASGGDCSGHTQVTWADDALYFFVHVNDDVLGKRVKAADCKRHWRTDSVEITLDPRGNSENTASTFKTGIFPTTDDPAHGNGPCFERDADNRQGPGPETAPGMKVASKLSSPYKGYDLEVKIPLANLPAAVDPQHLGMNILPYDSDTQDYTGSSRIAWSPFGGVQGDPYRWGQATMPGYTPPAGRPTKPIPPTIPATAATSLESPQSILQAATIGVPLAGGPAAPASKSARVVTAVQKGDAVTANLLATGAGKAYVFVYDPKAGTLASTTVAISGAGAKVVKLTAPGKKITGNTRVLVAFDAGTAGTASSAARIIRAS